MKEENLLLSETKSSKRLEELWNDWGRHTMFMSTGNCQHPTWNNLVEYGKNNQEETIAFCAEYLKEIGSNWCILTFIDNAIGDPIDHEKTPGYINPNSEDIR